MRLRVFHTIQYLYPTPVLESHHEVRMMPLSEEDQTCLDFRLTISPPTNLAAFDLPSGRVHHFDLYSPHRELVIHAESLVVTHRHDPFEGLSLTGEDGNFYIREEVRQNYADYLTPTRWVPLSPETDRIASAARRQGSVGTASFLIALTRLLHRVVTASPGSLEVYPAIQQVLEKNESLSREFAHLMLAVCRREGIPARYVRGYVYTGERPNAPSGSVLPPSEPGKDGGTSSSATPDRSGRPGNGGRMHDWVECLLPDNHWHGFDPTRNLLTNDSYIKVHHGRDYGDVPPVRGVYRGSADHALDVSLRIVAERA